MEARSYYEKAARGLRLARYGVLLLLIGFLLFSMTFYREDITFDNFRYLMKYLEISPPALSEGEKSITFSAASDATYLLLGDKPIVQTGNAVISYDTAGRKLLNETISYQNPTVTQNNKYMLIYDLDGFGLSVYNSFSKVCEKKLPTAAEYVYLDNDGGFAVITTEKSYAGGFDCYDSNYKKIYSFMTRTANVTDVCCDTRHKRAACVTTDARDGDYYAEIFTFDLNNDDEIHATTALAGELPLSAFAAADGFVLLTDSGFHCYDYDAVETAFVDFEYETPDALYRFDDFFAVTLKNSLAGAESTVRFYTYDGALLYSDYYKSEIARIHAADGYVYILEPYTLTVLQYALSADRPITEVETIDVDGEYKAAFALPEREYLLVSSSGALKGKLHDSSEPENELDGNAEGNAENNSTVG